MLQLIDYDRFNKSLTKLRDKKEKSLNDEKNLFKVCCSCICILRTPLTSRNKLEQDFEVASNEYDYINTAMKTDLPRFMQMATQFIDPLFHSFFYMQYVRRERPFNTLPIDPPQVEHLLPPFGEAKQFR